MPRRNLSETASHLVKLRETHSSRGCSIASRDNFVYGGVSKVNDELAGARALAFDKRGVTTSERLPLTIPLIAWRISFEALAQTGARDQTMLSYRNLSNSLPWKRIFDA